MFFIDIPSFLETEEWISGSEKGVAASFEAERSFFFFPAPPPLSCQLTTRSKKAAVPLPFVGPGVGPAINGLISASGVSFAS
ncbi:hypothetical protein CEXT_283551 [Caerostris extrusa]|uniref:Uncharacterized protein n=1 Tax=Caerostris extrusa TaxID=172846 RepID=A0AAV4WTD2_CAEEX|nr:hypothetical protein CEXT_283551 [Caerostris extrusa]